jgi:hypothetical protein
VFIPWLRCTDFDIVQILTLATVDIQGKPVTDLPGPPLAQANSEKIDALKRRAREIARDLRSRDDIQISYLETLEERDSDNLRLAQMLA